MSNRFQKSTGSIAGLPSFEFVCELTPEQIANVEDAAGSNVTKDFAYRLSRIIKTAVETILFPSPQRRAEPFRKIAAEVDKFAAAITIEEYGFAAAAAARRIQQETRRAADVLTRRPGHPVNEDRKRFFREALNLGTDCGLDLRFQSSNTNRDGWIDQPTPIFVFVKSAIGVVVEVAEDAAKVAGAAVGNDVRKRLADWRIADATLLNHLRKINPDGGVHRPTAAKTG